ncbi:copper chaperone PCu(A)C [Pusillimonas sp. TS35]|nr:copper chaperone PCu(A)C [Pusillimonas sp. TS35]
MALTVALATPAHAQVSVEDAWVRGTVSGQQATGVFMTLKSKTDAKLVAADSPIAGTVEIHEMAMDGNVMKMRQIPSLALPAGQTVMLKPGGYHIMLLDLKQPIKAGEKIPVSLVVEAASGKRETLQIEAAAQELGGGNMHRGGGPHNMRQR